MEIILKHLFIVVVDLIILFICIYYVRRYDRVLSARFGFHPRPLASILLVAFVFVAWKSITYIFKPELYDTLSVFNLDISWRAAWRMSPRPWSPHCTTFIAYHVYKYVVWRKKGSGGSTEKQF